MDLILRPLARIDFVDPHARGQCTSTEEEPETNPPSTRFSVTHSGRTVACSQPTLVALQVDYINVLRANDIPHVPTFILQRPSDFRQFQQQFADLVPWFVCAAFGLVVLSFICPRFFFSFFGPFLLQTRHPKWKVPNRGQPSVAGAGGEGCA